MVLLFLGRHVGAHQEGQQYCVNIAAKAIILVFFSFREPTIPCLALTEVWRWKSKILNHFKGLINSLVKKRK